MSTNLLYIQARLQFNFGDDRKRNEDILKTGRGTWPHDKTF
jgi:hypothetical protein